MKATFIKPSSRSINVGKIRNKGLKGCVMVTARMKSLEAQAKAAGSAFGFSEDEFDHRALIRPRKTRLAMLGLTLGAMGLGLVHHFMGLGTLVSSLQGWRSAA
jgi:hypothetical protein